MYQRTEINGYNHTGTKTGTCVDMYLASLSMSVHPKEDLSWVFIGGIDFEAETPILWPPHVKT